MTIAEKCFLLTQKFPKEELYGMVQQIRRASSSIPANISESYGRRSPGDYKRFLNIAQEGSAQFAPMLVPLLKNCFDSNLINLVILTYYPLPITYY